MNPCASVPGVPSKDFLASYARSYPSRSSPIDWMIINLKSLHVSEFTEVLCMLRGFILVASPTPKERS